MTSKLNLFYTFWLLELLALTVLVIGLTFAHSNAFVSGNQTAKFYFFMIGMVVILFIRCIQFTLSPQKLAICITKLDAIFIAFFLYIFMNRFMLACISGFTMRYYELLGLAVLYVLIRTLKKESYTVLFVIIILAGFIQAVYGNLQLFDVYPSHHNLFNLTGGFFNPGPYGGYLVSVLSIAVAFYLFAVPDSDSNRFQWNNQIKRKTLSERITTNSWTSKFPASCFTIFFSFQIFRFSNLQTYLTRYLALITILSIILVLPASGSRAAWIAAIISTLWLLAFRYDLKRIYNQFFQSPFKKTLSIILFVLLISGLTGGMYFFKQGSANGRLLIWQVTINMIQDRPVFGHGYEKFAANYMNYQAGFFDRHPDSNLAIVSGDVNYAFNEILKLTSETGLIGLGLLICSLIVLFLGGPSSPDRKNKICLYAGRAGIISILVFGLFSYPGSILPIKVNVVFFLAIIASFSQPLYRKPAFFIQPLVRVSFTSSIIAAGLFLILPYMKSLHKAHTTWKDGQMMYSLGVYENSLNAYKMAFPLLKEDGDFLVYYGKTLSIAGEHEEAIEMLNNARKYLSNINVFTTLGDCYKALGYYDEAEQAYRHAYQMSSRFYPLYLLAKLYDVAGEREKMVEAAQELIHKEVKVVSTAIDEMIIEMQSMLKRSQNDN